jgi:replicative DNA helicase
LSTGIGISAKPPSWDGLVWCNVRVDLSLQSLSGVLEQADGRLQAGSHAAPRVWGTGIELLDEYLAGGFRAGELILFGGAQGLGKTTFALQIIRNVALSGRSVVYFSFEHDPQTILERLIAIEVGERVGIDGVGLRRIRAAFEAMDGRKGTAAERLADTTGGGEALAAVQKYSDHLLIHRSNGSSTGLEVVREVIEEAKHTTGQLPLIVVDYLQKLYVPGGSLVEEERVTMAVEGLKDLALDIDIPVLAVVAADKEGITGGKRMRVNNLRGSSALAYEADTVLVLNEKFDVVARHHLMYDLGNAERFRQWAVLSIEKNRNGMDRIDMEFRKRFEQGRYEPDGNLVSEQLTDERVFVE